MIKIYSQPNCSKCKILKNALKDKHIEYIECSDLEEIKKNSVSKDDYNKLKEENKMLLDAVDLSLTFNYYFNKQATMENPLGGKKLDYDDSWEIGLGCDFQINEKIGVSAGTMYSKQGYKSDVNSAFSPVLDSVVAGCGAEYRIAKQVMVTAAYLHCFYFDTEYNYGQDLELSKNIDMLSVGVTVKPF